MVGDCLGIIVIPPGNFTRSNEDGSPKMEVVNVKLRRRLNRSSNNGLKTLKETRFIGEFMGSGRNPNTTWVQLDALALCIDKIATCRSQQNKWVILM